MLLLLPFALGFGQGFFFCLFSVISSMLELNPNHKGGDVMDDDIYMFEMFQQMMQQLLENSPDGRMRMLSRTPRYAADDPAKRKPDKKRGNRL